MCTEAVDKAIFPGGQGSSLMHNIAGKATGFGEALTEEFEEYAKQVVQNTKTCANVFRDHGFRCFPGGHR